MQVSRFSEEQIIPLLPQAERGEPFIGALCREHGLPAPTFYRWRTKCGGLTVPAAQRWREVAQEQARLTRWRAARARDVAARQALLVKNSSRWRHAVRPSRSWSPVGSRRLEPVSCGSGSARRAPSRLAPMATRSGPCTSTRGPDGLRALDPDACGRCADVAARGCTRSTCIGSGSG
jgi:putative transposase